MSATNSPDLVPTDDDTAWPEANGETPADETRPDAEEDATLDRDLAVNGSPD